MVVVTLACSLGVASAARGQLGQKDVHDIGCMVFFDPAHDASLQRSIGHCDVALRLMARFAAMLHSVDQPEKVQLKISRFRARCVFRGLRRA